MNTDGDTNGDGETDVTDLLVLLGAFGSPSCTAGAGGAPGGCLTASSGDTTTYDTIFDQPLGDDKTVVFTVTAANDAHLGFFSDTQSNDEVYEIVLSGWGNTMSTIRPCNQCSNSYQGEDESNGRRQTPGLLSGSEARTFWATANDGLVVVGAGGAVGQEEFMRWQDPDHHVANYIGVMTGWGATGDWSVCAAGWAQGCKSTCFTTFQAPPFAFISPIHLGD